jgi:hypothetical protein
LQMLANAVCGECGKIAAVVRLIAERSGQCEKFGQAGYLHFQPGGRLDIAGDQSRLITGMILDRSQRLTHSRQNLEHLVSVAGQLSHCVHVTLAQFVHAVADVFMREAFMFQSFANDLQVSHPRNFHFR